MSPSTSTIATTPVPTFESIGVKKVINCQGTYTIFTGSRILKQVADAMVEASNGYVQMDELMEAVGNRLAELTGAEFGYITCGCAASLTQLAAACIAGADPERMTRLPDTRGMKNEIVIQQRHRNQYDWAMRMTGARMVEVVTPADLEAAFCERTAMVALTGDSEERSTIKAQVMIDAAKKRGIPIIVDAAAQRPDIPNRYLGMGADAVCYSGGKCLRGPQASGLVLGKRDLLWAAFLNGAPHHAFGRPMKAGKEEIMGLLAGVEAWIHGRDHEDEWRMWVGYLEQIRAAVNGLSSVQAEIVQPGISNVAPTLKITWDADVLNVTPKEVHQALYEGDPPITMHLLPDGLRIMSYMMESGDEEVVAPRLRELLADRPKRQEPAGSGTPAAKVAGVWQVEIQYVLGTSVHSMTLVQDGRDLSGTYRGEFDSVPLEGSVQEQNVAFSARLGCQINTVRYEFEGTADGDTMSGEVALDEFGSATWKACKVA